MEEWTYLLDAKDLPPGSATRVRAGDKVVAICNDRGRIVVVDNDCPHAGGSLGRGDLHDGAIVCPIHRWPFDLRTGLTDPNFPQMRLTFFRCETRDGRIYADLARPIPPESMPCIPD